MDVVVAGLKGELHYGDDTVSPNTVYTYTLIAFDTSKTYSYPILLNASLDSTAEDTRCTVQEGKPVEKGRDTTMEMPQGSILW